MGTILTSYGDPGYDHEGYAAYVLDDGTLTGTWGPDTRPRMTGELVAACNCGWTGTTRHPGAGGDPLDEQARELALAEWEHTHARPVLEQAQHHALVELQHRLRSVSTSAAGLTKTRPRRELAEQLDHHVRVLANLTDHARRLADQAHEQVHEQTQAQDEPDQQ